INSAVLALAGHSAILAAAGSTQQSLLWQDIQRSLLPQDQLSSPCFGRTFSDPCCRRINSAVLALAGHSAILAAAGSTQQSLLWQDIQRSLLPQDQLSSPCSGRTFSDPCCRFTQQSLLWQDIQRSLLPQDQLSSPCFGRTFSDPCYRRINSAVLALAGHSVILAAARSTQQSLLWQDIQQSIQRSLLPQDQLSSPCSSRTSGHQSSLTQDQFTNRSRDERSRGTCREGSRRTTTRTSSQSTTTQLILINNTKGTVDAMRKEFGEWVEDNEGHAPHAERIDALAKKHGRNSPFMIPGMHIENPDVNRTATSLAKMDFASKSEEARRLEDQKREERRAPWGTSSTFPQNQTNRDHRTNLERNPVRDYAAVAKQVREWSFKFDGNSKPLEFLEQVEWSAATYGLELDLVPRAMPELLKGSALKWYRSQPASRSFSYHGTTSQSCWRKSLDGNRVSTNEEIHAHSTKPVTAHGNRRLQSTGEQRSMHSMRRKRQGTAAANAKGILRISNTRAQSYKGVQEMWTGRPLGERMQQRELAILLDVWANRSSHGPMLPIGKRPSASTSQERADADRSSSTKLFKSATGATSSFVSEELAVTLVEEGFELGATQRQVRLADGRSSGVTEQVEVQIGLGNRQVDLALLVLPGVIDELVLGWDFLSTMGTILECAGIQVRIPARRRRNKDQEERLSVVNTLEQLSQEPVKMSQQQKGDLNKRPARRLPFHPHRRSSRKLPRLELDAAMTDVLELSTSPILDPAVEAGLTPPPTVSPGSAGTVFRWPEQQQQQPEVQQQQQQPEVQQQQQQQPEVQQQLEVQQQQQQPEQQRPKQQKQRRKQQKQPPAQQQPTLSLPTQPTTLPTAQPARPLLPAVPAAQPRAQPAAPLPIRPLTPTIIVVTGPPGPKQFDELIGIAWPSEVSRAARMLNPRKRRIRVVWSGGVRFKLKAGQGKFRATFADPCCRRINSAVLALAGHPAILAAAGLTQQSLLWQDIQRSLLWQDIQRSLLPQD
ncbi:hypothetical protein ACLKA7_014649, partial [Drosophila subpalustris]